MNDADTTFDRADRQAERLVCRLCLRNCVAEKDSFLTTDKGKTVYGLRDCYISADRLEMDLRDETFFSKMGKSSKAKKKDAKG